MDPGSLPQQMRSAATVLLRALTNQQRTAGARSFAGDAARRWLEYRPRPRPGACIAPACVSYAAAAPYPGR